MTCFPPPSDELFHASQPHLFNANRLHWCVLLTKSAKQMNIICYNIHDLSLTFQGQIQGLQFEGHIIILLFNINLISNFPGRRGYSNFSSVQVCAVRKTPPTPFLLKLFRKTPLFPQNQFQKTPPLSTETVPGDPNFQMFKCGYYWNKRGGSVYFVADLLWRQKMAPCGSSTFFKP